MIEWRVAPMKLGLQALLQNIPKITKRFEQHFRPLSIEARVDHEDNEFPGTIPLVLTFRNIGRASITVHLIQGISPRGLLFQKPKTKKRESYWAPSRPQHLIQQMAGIPQVRQPVAYKITIDEPTKNVALNLVVDPEDAPDGPRTKKTATWKCYLIVPDGTPSEHVRMEVCSTLNLAVSREISAIIQIKNTMTPNFQRIENIS